MATQINYTYGNQIAVKIGGAASHSAVVSKLAHLVVVGETEKAVNLKGDNGDTIWLPKKALVATTNQGIVKLAGWFKPNAFQDRFLITNCTISGLSNA
jgi:phosphoenolpyruvate-protein kinase (PTS system EI component)